MALGKFADLRDRAPFDVILGIGNRPNPQSLELARQLEEYGKELGLRVGTNTPFLVFKDGQPVLNEDGKVKTTSFNAAGDNTTRSFAQRTAEKIGYNPALVQMELSTLLRYMPSGKELDPQSRVMGVYLGYLMTRRLVELGA